MLDLKTINAYDIILMPNFMMPQIASCTSRPDRERKKFIGNAIRDDRGIYYCTKSIE